MGERSGARLGGRWRRWSWTGDRRRRWSWTGDWRRRRSSPGQQMTKAEADWAAGDGGRAHLGGGRVRRSSLWWPAAEAELTWLPPCHAPEPQQQRARTRANVAATVAALPAAALQERGNRQRRRGERGGTAMAALGAAIRLRRSSISPAIRHNAFRPPPALPTALLALEIGDIIGVYDNWAYSFLLFFSN